MNICVHVFAHTYFNFIGYIFRNGNVYKKQVYKDRKQSSEWLRLEVGVVLTVNRHEKFSKVIRMFQK